MSDTDPGLGASPKGSASPSGKAGTLGTVPCPACGSPVDPLRAERVAILEERFRYFCSASCRERYGSGPARPRPPPRRKPSEDAAALGAAHGSALALADVAGVDAADQDFVEPRSSTPAGVPTTTDVGALLLAIAVAGSLLATVLLLVGAAPGALMARLLFVTIAAAALAAEAALGRRDARTASTIVASAGAVLAVGICVVMRVTLDARLASTLTLAGFVIAATAGSEWIVQRARRPLEEMRADLLRALSAPARRVIGDQVMDAIAADLRPGEVLYLEPGDVIPVDATLVSGSATVTPWLGAKQVEARTEGQTVIAGARVIEGRVRVVATWTGADRAVTRMATDPRRRADFESSLARIGRLCAERGTLVVSPAAALAAFAADADLLGVLVVAVAAHATVAHAAVAHVAALHVGRAIFAGLGRGIVFRTAAAFDRASRVSTAAFCARGTLLVGEPEVASIEAFGSHTQERVISLVAGAEAGSVHPTARAVLRAARERGVRPDASRSPSAQPGLGVTAIVSTGEPLVVGSRALMLRERISIAAAESKIVELETMGRTAILVAFDGRLAGILGLQDGLRPGARAAVQHLLDVGIEPVLLSGDARDTCEALGRALDIEHIRPEVLPSERGDEIRRLADGGAIVAVLGRSPGDDSALSAADVSIALGAAGSASAEWGVQLASESVRDAAYALRLAHRCRAEANLGTLLAVAPGLAATLTVAFGLAPPIVAPLAAGVAAIAALTRFRGGEDPSSNARLW